ncbi:MAG: hypothetical protein GQ524_07595 [Anaerolineales bacterium]|nr:hypothetical protein [Anaerolineales bacterium]
MTDFPAGVLEDVIINSKSYRIVPQSYQINDVSDYAPRGETPGTSSSFGDLQLYQPLTQESWTTGIGYVWGTDPGGYLLTEGDVDARFPGSIFMSSRVQNVVTLAGLNPGNMVSFHDSTGGFGDDDLTFFCDKGATLGLYYIYYSSGVIQTSERSVLSGADINYIWTNGTFFFVNFSDGDLDDLQERNGLMMYATTPATVETAARAALNTAVAGVNNDLTYTAVEAGTDGNSITVEYVDTATAGSETVAVTGTDILVGIEAGVTTGIQLLAALRASGDAMYLCQMSHQGGNDGTGVVPVMTKTNLFSGTGSPIWQKCGVNGFARGFGQTVLHNGFAYVQEEGTNYVHYASETDMSDIEGDGPLDAAVIIVGPGDIPVVQLITYGTALYAARYDGLWSIGEDNIARKVLDFTNEYSLQNFASVAVWNGLLIFPIRNKIYSWNGSRLVDITPLSNADPNPSARSYIGRRTFRGVDYPMALKTIDGATFDQFCNFDSFIGVGEYFYCTAARASDTTDAYLLAWSGSGWHSINQLDATVDKYSGAWYDAVQHYLYLYNDKNGTNEIQYKRFDPNMEFPIAGYYNTSGTHRITLSNMTMGQKRVLKSSPSIIVSVQNCTDNRMILVEYSLDGGAWTGLAYIASTGLHELNFAGDPPTLEPPTVEYYYISLRFTFDTDSTSQTPVIEDVTIRYIMRPGTVYGWFMEIIGGTYVRYGSHTMDQTSEEIKTELKSARDSAPPIKYVDLDGVDYWVYLTSMNGRVVEISDRSGVEEGAIEYRFRVSLVQTGLITA